MSEPEQGGSVDDWLNDENPASYRKDAPPTTDDLRDALDNAPEAPRKDQDVGSSPRPHPEARHSDSDETGDPGPSGPPSGASGGGGGRPTRARMEIYDDCPVTPLGKRGKFCYYLDVLGQLRAIDNHNAQNIQSLFGHQIPNLCYHFAQWKEDKDGGFKRVQNRFDATTASMMMNAAASECGVFNPDNAVRGVGAWTNDDGELVYHMGDQVLVAGKMHKPGKIDKHIYPAQPTIPHPDPSDTAPDPVPELQRILETWNWSVPDVHPHIALGMIATQILCGALDWRPVFWLVAPAGSGKSEFQRLVKMMHGDDGLIQTTDATKSGITSKLGQSSLPVAVDELEPGDERSTKERDIIALARVAASGGEWFRGSADQTGVGGKVYSAFFFSSILIPGVMKTQDVQRLIRLELKPLTAGAAKLNMQPRTWRARGARLKQLLIQRWPTWPERMAAWRISLENAGVMGRDADNWGTVLAMADMAMQEDIAEDAVRASWAQKIAFVANADRDETMNDADGMLLHLMSQQYDPFRRGQQFNVAQWVMTAAELPGAPEALRHALGEDDGPSSKQIAAKKANSMLGSIGLRVYETGEKAKVFIMNKPIQPLKDLFRGSDWAGGVWKQSAARVPGAEPPPNPPTVSGITSRGFLMPITSIPGLMAFPINRDPRAAGPAGSVTTGDVNDWG